MNEPDIANELVTMESDSLPTLAIVGHPNKGKSSIVSTLAQDSSVHISPLSGTTVSKRSYPMKVDGKTLYRLVDTPGFQRARAAMDWMLKHSRSAADHQSVVANFVEKHAQDPRFSAESELLKPIIAGAGILYVIDGSVPYGPEYDAEMEILRWTGQPSMALINPIGSADYIDQWRQPLSQYFRIVRVFNARSESFERQIQLLTGFAELSEQWHQPLKEAARFLVDRRHQQINQAAARIVELVLSALICQERAPVKDKTDQVTIDQATDRFRDKLHSLEQQARDEIEQIFSHQDLQREESPMAIHEQDLFSKKTWQLFGLSRDQVLTMGILGGAATGGLLDIGSGGLTMMLGTGVGAVVGGASAWFGSRQLIGTRILGLPMGGNEVVVGPITNISFPWVLLGRAVTHLRLLCHRTHAMRDAFAVSHSVATETSSHNDSNTDSQQAGIAAELNIKQRKMVQAVFSKFTDGKDPGEADKKQLASLIAGLVENPGGLESKAESKT